MLYFYVTATHVEASARPGLPPTLDGRKHPPEQRVRTDLGKFLSKAAAEAHAQNLDRSWLLPRVEERNESADPFHVSKVGTPTR